MDKDPKTMEPADWLRYLAGELSDKGNVQCGENLRWAAARIQQLEARNAELEAEVEKLREGYREAIDDIDSWGAYASNYFQQKHDLEGCIKMHEKALTAGEVD